MALKDGFKEYEEEGKQKQRWNQAIKEAKNSKQPSRSSMPTEVHFMMSPVGFLCWPLQRVCTAMRALQMNMATTDFNDATADINLLLGINTQP